jgi:hypothetical protein
MFRFILATKLRQTPLLDPLNIRYRHAHVSREKAMPQGREFGGGALRCRGR